MRHLVVIMMIGVLCSSVAMGKAKKSSSPKKASKQISFTLNEYIQAVLRHSDRAKREYNGFKNAVNSYKSTFRQLNLPSANAFGGLSKSQSDTNSVITETEISNGGIGLTQPFYPTGATITADVSESTNKTDIGGVINRSRTNPSYTVTMSQPLFIFVGNSAWRTWKRAKVNFTNAQENYKQRILVLKNEARNIYYDVLRTRDEVEVEKSKLKASERSWRITAALVKAGRYAGVEKSRSTVRLENDRRNLKDRKTALKKAINDALEFVSMEMDSKITFSSKLTYAPLTIPLEKLMAYAFLHNPSYLSAGRSLTLSELDLRETKENNNPTIGATASIGRSDTFGSDDREIIGKRWSGGVDVRWPFFDSGRSRLAVRNATNDLENDRMSFRELKRSIQRDVKNSFLDVKNKERQLDEYKRSIKEAKKTVRIVQARYKNGKDRLVDVFDSQNELRKVELDYVNAMIEANFAKGSLAVTIGGPLEEVMK